MKTFLRVFPIILILLLAYGCRNYELVPQTEKKPAQLPDFTYQTLDGKSYTKADLDTDKNLIFIYLDPECIFCQTAIQRFKRRMADFEDSQFLIVSVHSENELEQFNELHELDNYPQMKLVRDRNNQFARTFYTKDYPVIYIYSADGKYIKDFQGLTDIDLVERAIEGTETSVQ